MMIDLPFWDVKAEWAPENWDKETEGTEGTGRRTPPVFSEAFLYPALGKDDARFILGVAKDYEHVTKALGAKALRLLLDVKPILAQRLQLPNIIIDCLQDAASWEYERRERSSPSQVILDGGAARAIWKLLHGEYRRLFNPEVAMNRNRLRAYHTLTDSLGSWEQEGRQKEIDRLPEKLLAMDAQKIRRAEEKRLQEQLQEQHEERVRVALSHHPGFDEETAKAAAFVAVQALKEELRT